MSQAEAQSERPLRRDAERNRQRILDAARVVFAERGLSGSHDDIAREAGVGVGTVYRRFPDKEELIDALFEERIGEIADAAKSALDAEDPWEGLVSFLFRAQELQSQDKGLKEIILSGDRGQDRVIAARSLIAPLAERVLDRAKVSGAIRDDVEITDFPVIQLAVGAIADAGRDISPDAWRRVMTIILDGLRTDRAAFSPLPIPALDQDQVDAVMHCAGTIKRR